MLIYAETLGKFGLFAEILVNSSQLGWCTVPIRSLPLLFDVLGALQITDQDDSWIRMMSKCIWILSMVLMMRWFLQTFCENILRFCRIIVGVCCPP